MLCVRAGPARPLSMNPFQLSLPIDEFLARAPSPGIPRPRRVFCNRNLRMSNIAWVGFDMDYTLAIYNQREMDELSIRATIEKLVARGYPEFVRSIPYSTDFPVRGLLIDKRFGHILKMDRYKFVTKGYHGFRELAKEELRALYHSKKIRPATPRYHWIDTLYALSEAALYAALVEAMEKRGLAIDYAKTFTDIRECIDEAHRDGTILETVAARLPALRQQGPRARADAPQAAQRRQEALPADELALVVHRQDDDLPARRRDERVPALAQLLRRRHRRRHQARLLPGAPAADGARRREARARRRSPLERGKIYEGGNLRDLERALGVTGDEVLYVGDHIYGDILRSKKESAWRTAMIIQELEGEVLAHDSCREDFAPRRVPRGRRASAWRTSSASTSRASRSSRAASSTRT